MVLLSRKAKLSAPPAAKALLMMMKCFKTHLGVNQMNMLFEDDGDGDDGYFDDNDSDD